MILITGSLPPIKKKLWWCQNLLNARLSRSIKALPDFLHLMEKKSWWFLLWKVAETIVMQKQWQDLLPAPNPLSGTSLHWPQIVENNNYTRSGNLQINKGNLNLWGINSKHIVYFHKLPRLTLLPNGECVNVFIKNES